MESPKDEKGKVALWHDRISLSRKFRDRSLEDLGVNRFTRYFKGEYDVRIGNMPVPPINEVNSYTQTLASILNFRNPYLTLNPKKNATILGARILEQCLAYDWRTLKIKEENDASLLDVPIAGYSWQKTGYYAEKTKEGYLKTEKIYSQRASWRDVVWNIGSIRPPIDSQWIAHRIIKPTYQVKKLFPGNPDLKGGPHPYLNESEIKHALFKDDIEYTSYWEIYDVENQEILCVAHDYEKYLKKPVTWPDWMDIPPLDRLAWNLIPDESFPIPDIALIEAQILEEIKLVAMALNHTKRWNRQLVLKKGAFDEQEKDKLEKGLDGIMPECNGEPAASHSVLQYAPLPPDVYAIINKINEIRSRISGLTMTSMGGTDTTKTRTVGELQMMQQGSGLRTDKKRDIFERHIESIARKIIKIRQANFDLEQVVKITGEAPMEIIQAFGDKYDPITKSIRFTKEDIQGDYDVEVQAGSTMAIDKSMRMAVLEKVLQMSIPLAQAQSLPPFIQVVITELLKDYDLKVLEQAFNVQSQQAEMAKMGETTEKDAQTEKTQAEAEKRKAQAQQIKTETVIQGAQALAQAAQMGLEPELIELSRGAGVLP